MTKYFRTMKKSEDGLPVVGRGFLELGVRIEGSTRDIQPGTDGSVEPETGGMSVSWEPRRLPKALRPKSLDGESAHPVFGVSEAALPGTLVVRQTKRAHALVEPATHQTLQQYEAALASTRPSWSVSYE